MTEHASHANDALAVRLAVQEIITTQVVLRDRTSRDRLLDECVDTYGVEVVNCISAFIYCNAVEGVVTEIVSDRFYYLLTRIGDLVELAAEVGGVEPSEVLITVTEHDWEYSDDPEDEGTAEAVRAVESIRAAQVCLVSHHFTRRGAAPWGIQRSLDLEDMCEVVDGLGMVLISLVSLFSEEHFARYTRILLADVEMILNAVARARHIPVSELVSEYFMALILDDT